MAFSSTILNIVGIVLLAHAVYSANEHNRLSKVPTTLIPSLSSPSSTSTSTPTIDLPLDITLETLLSVVLISTGLVLGAPALKPISWRVWAGRIEREGRKANSGQAVARNPYMELESRRGFLDVRAQRRDFADWVRTGGGAGGK